MWIHNNSEHDLEDGYDGKRYLFASGKSTEVPAVVAHHVFGFGDDDKRPYLIRLGWIQQTNDYSSAVKKLNEFSFSSEQPKPTVHVLSPVVDAKALALPKKRSGAIVQLAA